MWAYKRPSFGVRCRCLVVFTNNYLSWARLISKHVMVLASIFTENVRMSINLIISVMSGVIKHIMVNYTWIRNSANLFFDCLLKTFPLVYKIRGKPCPVTYGLNGCGTLTVRR